MIMASRLLYGMAREDVVPAPFGLVHSDAADAVGRDPVHDRVAAVLIITGDLETLADTTVALLVFVFAIVNATVLVPAPRPGRPRPLPGPVVFPVLGVGVSIALLTQIEGETWVRAGILIAVGLVLYAVNAVVLSRTAPATS